VADRLFLREGTGARLYVAPRCKNTIREFGAYRRRKDPRSSGEDPVFVDDFAPGNDHAMDALRYAIFNYFGGPDRRRGGVSHEAIG
jgi:phage terminase large subunit